ncbi:prostatic acid phosphatase-like [Contarinia nasturtii]|uniref:prostatic acid phosphatase-like n=1 Tax=Contarinia nasturtii TaxID=265458 RepID=UPI0012D471F4|nr:prostatic acid phosphatase-like [Contarinia nasturtii]
MKNIMFYVVVLLMLCLQLASSKPYNKSESSELVFAHVIFRHGQRNPLITYPNDPWKDEEQFWKEGYGQLINAGKQQHYELGKYLRKRYMALLENGSYSPKIVYIQSTDVDRTLMSAASNLAGFFPPKGDQIWKDDLLWQPIPIHTIPTSLDYVLNAEAPCPRYEQALKRYEQTPEYQNIFIKYKWLFEYLENNTGMPISTLIDVQYLNDALWIQNITNKALPEWTKKVFIPGGDMEKLSNICYTTNTSTPELARLKAGFLFREILDRFDDKIESNLDPNRNLWLYSAHDSTIASFLNSIGLFELHTPPYAASLMIELYKENDAFYFQIFYRKSNDDILSPLHIPKCGQKCSIRKFRDAYKEIIPTDSYEKECGL